MIARDRSRRWLTRLAFVLFSFIPSLVLAQSNSTSGQPPVSPVGQLPFSAGNWTATTDRGAYADTGTSGQENLALILPAKSTHFQIALTGFQSALRAGSPATFQVNFDDGAAMIFVGASTGPVVLAKIADTDVAKWTHEMTAEHMATITFTSIQELNGASEPTWSIPLTGATATVTALAEAMSQAGVVGLPSPWNTNSIGPTGSANNGVAGVISPADQPVSTSSETTTSGQTAASQPASPSIQESMAPFSNPAGITYAQSGETTWTSNTASDEMTDKTVITVVSEQDNGSGADAEVTGTCKNNGVLFSATIIDASGGTSVNLSNQTGQGNAQTVAGEIRINSDPMADFQFPQPEFSNQFEIADLLMDPLVPNMLDVAVPRLNFQAIWRILAQVDTDHGQILIKIPMYDSQIENLVKACVGKDWNMTYPYSLGGEAQRIGGSFGITFKSSESGGAEINSVEPYSLADEAGIRPGDIIGGVGPLSLFGLKSISTPDDFNNYVTTLQQDGAHDFLIEMLHQGEEGYVVLRLPSSNQN